MIWPLETFNLFASDVIVYSYSIIITWVTLIVTKCMGMTVRKTALAMDCTATIINMMGSAALTRYLLQIQQICQALPPETRMGYLGF